MPKRPSETQTRKPSKLIYDIGWSAILKVGYVVCQMLVNIIFARWLGVEEFGGYALIIAWLQLLLVPTLLGFPSSLVRHIPEHLNAGNGAASRKLQRVAIFSVLLTSLVMTLFWGVTGYQMNPVRLVALVLTLAALAQAEIAGAMLRGLGYVVESQIVLQILRPIIMLLTIGVLIVSEVSFSLDVVLGVQAFAAIAVAIYAHMLVWTKFRPLPREGRSPSTNSIIMASLPFLFLAGVQVANYQTNIIVMGWLLEPLNVGIYRVAVQIADGLGVFLFAVSVALGPRIVQLELTGNYKVLKSLLVRAHLVAGGLMLLAAGVICVIAKPLIVLLFGDSFGAASAPLTLLAFGKAFYAFVAFSGLGLSMLGRPGLTTVALLIGLVTNIILAFCLIPSFGLMGGAWASVLSAFVGNFIAATFLIRLINRRV